MLQMTGFNNIKAPKAPLIALIFFIGDILRWRHLPISACLRNNINRVFFTKLMAVECPANNE